MVVTDNAEVTSKSGPLGKIPKGTQFSVKQKSGPWLLGGFQLNSRRVFGWVSPRCVQVLEPDISQQPYHEFKWMNLLLAYDKLNDDFALEDHIDYYMRKEREDVWDRYHDDEFQLARKRIETIGMVQARRETFDVEQDLLLKTELTFKKYDFEAGMFPIKEATKENYWYENGGYDDVPSSIYVYMQDPALISGIPMSASEAERFLRSRKNSYGSVNRTVYANVRLRLVKVRDEGKLEAEVRWAQFYRDRDRTQLIYETPSSPLLAFAPAPPSGLGAESPMEAARKPEANPSHRQLAKVAVVPEKEVADELPTLTVSQPAPRPMQTTVVRSPSPMAQPMNYPTFATYPRGGYPVGQQPYQRGQS